MLNFIFYLIIASLSCMFFVFLSYKTKNKYIEFDIVNFLMFSIIWPLSLIVIIVTLPAYILMNKLNRDLKNEKKSIQKYNI